MYALIWFYIFHAYMWAWVNVAEVQGWNWSPNKKENDHATFYVSTLFRRLVVLLDLVFIASLSHTA